MKEIRVTLNPSDYKLFKRIAENENFGVVGYVQHLILLRIDDYKLAGFKSEKAFQTESKKR